MKVFLAMVDGTGFAPLRAVREDMKSLHDRLERGLVGRRPLRRRWEPPEMYVFQTGPAARPTADVTQITLVDKTFGSRAVAALGPMLLDHGELLPITGPEEAFSVHHFTRHVDPRDPLTAEAPGFTFVPERLAGLHYFRLPTILSTFVSDTFVRVYDEHLLTGLTFREVWPAAQRGPTRPAARKPGF